MNKDKTTPEIKIECYGGRTVLHIGDYMLGKGITSIEFKADGDLEPTLKIEADASSLEIISRTEYEMQCNSAKRFVASLEGNAVEELA